MSGAVIVRRCAEPQCPVLLRCVDVNLCPAHRRSTTPDRTPSRNDLERDTDREDTSR